MKTGLEKLTAPLAVLVICLSTGVTRAELLGHWKFDESAGTVAYDSSFYGNDGTLEGSPQWTDGRYGNALEFDGRGCVNFGALPDLATTETITVACWVKPARLEGLQGLVGVEGAYAFKIQGESVWFTTPGIQDHSSSKTTLEVGTWQHVAVTFQAGQSEGLVFYLNGVETERMTSSVVNRSAGPLIVGNNQWRETYSGLIDDVRLYTHILDEDEIKQLYDRGEASLAPIGYVAQLTEEAEKIVKESEPKEAVVYIENRITDYETWRIKNLGGIKSRDERPSSDIYALLAKAKEAAGTSPQDAITAYKQSVSHPHKPSHYIPESLLWLFKNIPADKYVHIVRECVRNSDDPSRNIYDVAGYFESRNNWPAFALFLDTVFSEPDDRTSYAKVVAKGLTENGAWANRFVEYCRDRPELTEYLFQKDDRAARGYMAQKNFAMATEIYRNILDRCGPRQRKATYELRLSECLFSSGRYDRAVGLIDSLVKDGLTDRALVREAIMLKGQACVRLGDIDRAADAFLSLAIEHPKAKEAPEACFFVGYCYMLQGKFGEATDAFNLVVKDYPESSYADKARSFLERIRKMTG